MSKIPTTLPTLFREALSDAGMPAIDEWWAQLDEPSRSEALRLWEDNQAETQLTVRMEARFADEPEEGNGGRWHSDYYDYLVNHEVYLFNVPGVHICTRHPMAAEAVRRGVIPQDFSCPLADSACPMRKLLASSGVRSVRLRLSLVPTEKRPERPDPNPACRRAQSAATPVE